MDRVVAVTVLVLLTVAPHRCRLLPSPSDTSLSASPDLYIAGVPALLDDDTLDEQSVTPDLFISRELLNADLDSAERNGYLPTPNIASRLHSPAVILPPVFPDATPERLPHSKHRAITIKKLYDDDGKLWTKFPNKKHLVEIVPLRHKTKLKGKGNKLAYILPNSNMVTKSTLKNQKISGIVIHDSVPVNDVFSSEENSSVEDSSEQIDSSNSEDSESSESNSSEVDYAYSNLKPYHGHHSHVHASIHNRPYSDDSINSKIDSLLMYLKDHKEVNAGGQIHDVLPDDHVHYIVRGKHHGNGNNHNSYNAESALHNTIHTHNKHLTHDNYNINDVDDDAEIVEHTIWPEEEVHEEINYDLNHNVHEATSSSDSHPHNHKTHGEHNASPDIQNDDVILKASEETVHLLHNDPYDAVIHSIHHNHGHGLHLIHENDAIVEQPNQHQATGHHHEHHIALNSDEITIHDLHDVNHEDTDVNLQLTSVEHPSSFISHIDNANYVVEDESLATKDSESHSLSSSESEDSTSSRDSSSDSSSGENNDTPSISQHNSPESGSSSSSDSNSVTSESQESSDEPNSDSNEPWAEINHIMNGDIPMDNEHDDADDTSEDNSSIEEHDHLHPLHDAVDEDGDVNDINFGIPDWIKVKSHKSKEHSKKCKEHKSYQLTFTFNR